MPSINMTVINSGADNDWDKYVAVDPEYALEESEVGLTVLISKGESGRERRRVKNATARRTFQLKFSGISHLEVDRIFGLYLDRKASGYSFSWKRPSRASGDSAVIYNVRFSKDGLSKEWMNGNLHSTGLELTELQTSEL